jgi:uncharacterized membrane protein
MAESATTRQQPPGVATAISIIGWIIAITSVLGVIYGYLADASAVLLSGAVFLIGGLLLIGLASLIEVTHRK